MSRNAAEAIQNLFAHAKDTMSTEELEKLGNLKTCGESIAFALSETLNTLACSIANLDKTYQPGQETLAHILWQLGDQAELVSVCIDVGSEAEFLANKMRQAGTDEQGVTHGN